VPKNTSVTLPYTVSGTATRGSDYTLSGTPDQVTFGPNQGSVLVTLTAIKDGIKETDEKLTITFPNGSGGTIKKDIKIHNRN